MSNEAEAYALLKRHCAPLRWAKWANLDFKRRHSWPDAVREHVDIIMAPPGSTDESASSVRGLGARVRLALSVAHAVSCCRDFEPATHQRFWRHVTKTLWARDRFLGGFPDGGSFFGGFPDRFAFSPTTFAHVAIEWSTCTPADDAFWTGFFHGTRSTVARLATVLNQLRPFMGTSAPPTLRVSLSHCYARDPTAPNDDATAPNPNLVDTNLVVSSNVLRTILRAALDTPQVGAWPSSAHLGLLVAYRIDDNTTSTCETLACLSRARAFSHPTLAISLDRVAIQLAPPNAPRCAAPSDAHRGAFMVRGRALGELLRALVINGTDSFRIQTLDVLGSSYSDFRLVGAALSAAALASFSLAELRCGRLCDASRTHEKPMRLAWLAFVLLCRRRHPESDYLQQLLNRGLPLQDVVREALRLRFAQDEEKVVLRSLESLPFGSTVRLVRGAQLYFEPMRNTEEFVAVVLDDEEDVDWIASIAGCAGWVGVVCAGFGLVWANTSCVVERKRLGEGNDAAPLDMGGHPQPAVALCSLALSFEGMRNWPDALAPHAFRVAPLLRLLSCHTLTSLTIDCAVLLRGDLALLLASFPSLQSLSLDRCVVESVAPLIDAYTRIGGAQPRLTALSLLGTHDLRLRHRLTNRLVTLRAYRVMDTQRGDAPVWISPLVAALTSGVARGVLRELYVDCRAMASESDERAIVEALTGAIASGALPLARLHITSHAEDACEVRLGPLCDDVRAGPLRTRTATLSGLRAVGCALPEIARIVLEMVESVVVVTWDSFLNS